jgi:diguanylate cyclase (GGDEF)-like protein
MNLTSIIPLAAGLAYIPLLCVLIMNSKWQKNHKLFGIYLISAMIWSISDFFLRSEFLLSYKVLLFQIVMSSMLLVLAQYYYFIRHYLYGSGGLILYLSYALLGIFIAACILGYIPQGLIYNNGEVSPSLGGWIIIITVPPTLILASLIYYMVKRFRVSEDPSERNRIKYFLAGIGMVTFSAFLNLAPIGTSFPVAHMGRLISAAILTYAFLRYRILDTKFLFRRGFFYALMLGLYLLAYLVWLVLFDTVLGIAINSYSCIIIALFTGISLAVIWRRARLFFTEKTEELFYGETYSQRQELADFVREKIRGVFSLQELSQGLLPPLSKVLNCQQACMLIPEIGSGDFVSEFSEPPLPEDKLIRLSKNSPIINWLKQERRYLTKENLIILPEFRGLLAAEIDKINKLDIALFFPFISRDNLIGILALGHKYSGKYTLDETNTIDSITNQAAITLEKEYLREEIKKQEQELQLINRLSVLITSSLNIQEVYDAFVSGLREMIHVDFATVALIDGEDLHFSALSSQVGSAWKVGERIPLKDTAAEWIITHKRCLMEPDLEKDITFATGQEFLRRGIRSIVYLPLIVKDDGIGALIIGSRLPNAYPRPQVNLLERLASQISVSIANAQLYSKAEQRARIDELTGLYNRRHFDETLSHEIERHSRYGSMLALVYIDLDNFKKFNDSKGHLAGDKMLTQIGNSIHKATRNVDFAFRYGGDEFAIVMPHTSAEDSLIAVERIRSEIAAKYADISISASIGIASWPSDGLTMDQLIDAADKALYHAKRTGGNRSCLVSQMLLSTSETEEGKSDFEKESLNTIYALASTIEARDPYTYGHSQKVRSYAVALAENLGLPGEKVAIISHAALLHDIGKIGIYDEVLNKPGKLDPTEFELVKTHPQLSRTIVAHITSLTPCLQAIVQHHERWDGTGYPNKLKGESISLEGRILAIADAFDAMTSKRPYHDPMSSKKAIQELKRCAGAQFDPKLVEIFIPIALSIIPQSSTGTEQKSSVT